MNKLMPFQLQFCISLISTVKGNVLCRRILKRTQIIYKSLPYAKKLT